MGSDTAGVATKARYWDNVRIEIGNCMNLLGKFQHSEMKRIFNESLHLVSMLVARVLRTVDADETEDDYSFSESEGEWLELSGEVDPTTVQGLKELAEKIERATHRRYGVEVSGE